MRLHVNLMAQVGIQNFGTAQFKSNFLSLAQLQKLMRLENI